MSVVMESVISSNVDQIGYDGEEEILVVKYKTGAIYKYFNIPYTMWHEIKGTPSIGRFINSRIKPTHKFERVVAI